MNGRCCVNILIRFGGFALKCSQEDKKIQQEDYEKDIINSILLVGCNNGAGNIFAWNSHNTLSFKMHATISNQNSAAMRYYELRIGVKSIGTAKLPVFILT